MWLLWSHLAEHATGRAWRVWRLPNASVSGIPGTGLRPAVLPIHRPLPRDLHPHSATGNVLRALGRCRLLPDARLTRRTATSERTSPFSCGVPRFARMEAVCTWSFSRHTCGAIMMVGGYGLCEIVALQRACSRRKDSHCQQQTWRLCLPPFQLLMLSPVRGHHRGANLEARHSPVIAAVSITRFL